MPNRPPKTVLGLHARRHPILLAFTVALIVMLVPVYGLWREATSRSDEQARESADRRDQTCLLFERQHETAVVRVERTYDYLDGLKGADRTSTLTGAIVRSLHDTYQEARDSKAPHYCDVPGVGLGEPGTKLPKERLFTYLLKRG